MWKAGTLSPAEFQQKKSELFSGVGTVRFRGSKSRGILFPPQSKSIWVVGALTIAAVGLIVVRHYLSSNPPELSSRTQQLTSRETLPLVLAPALPYEVNGEPWSRVDEVPV